MCCSWRSSVRCKIRKTFSETASLLQDEILSPSRGPLGSFSSRMRLARALSWISEAMYFDLEQIRVIRNEFAHNFDHALSFADQSVADKCKNLNTAKELFEGSEYAASVAKSKRSAKNIREIRDQFLMPRQRFEITVELLAQFLDLLSDDSPKYHGLDFKKLLWDMGTFENFGFWIKDKSKTPL